MIVCNESHNVSITTDEKEFDCQSFDRFFIACFCGDVVLFYFSDPWFYRYFSGTLSKVRVSCGGSSPRLCFMQIIICLPSGLSFAIGRFARVLITGEQVSEMVSPLRMMPTGSDSGNSSPGWTSLLGSTGQQPSVVPSGGSLSGGWTRFDEDVLLEADSGASSSGHSNSNPYSNSNPSRNQPRPGEQAMPPANPVASGEAEAGPSHVLPFPYEEDEVIGGDSVLSIQQRLLAQYDSPSAHDIAMARIEAQDRFEVKVEIIRLMAPLDPEGDWERRGARALDNPRTKTGEESYARLCQIRDSLSNEGIQSPFFFERKGLFAFFL